VFIFFFAVIIAYFAGSIPTSYIVGKSLHGIDLRTKGSGNLGATNAFRVLGWKSGLFVLICDILKGLLPVLVIPGIVVSVTKGDFNIHNFELIIGLATILGHIFTVFMKFKGGKGVAASVGVFLALAPISSLITLIICITIILVSRYVSLGSVTGAFLLPILILIFYPGRIPLIIFSVLVGGIVIIKHRSNIRRLINGKENKLFS
jgi:acyl phosphate:glycerol-3-phosphate acyltransferase